jgi:predicted GNAT family acetyltransferase
MQLYDKRGQDMKFKLYKEVHEFYKDTYDVLMRHEEQNIIPLGNIIIGHEGKDKSQWRDPANWIMATVSDEKEVRLTALMTPPHNLTLYATDNIIDSKAINCLIEGLKDHSIPGVTTERSLAEYFAKEYTRQKGLSYKTDMEQRIYELKAVNPEIRQFGKLRLLEEKDMSFFPYWLEAFNAAMTYGKKEMAIPQDGEVYSQRISKKQIYVLEVDGIPVSMAGLSREMKAAVGVSYVYTPPYYGGKGYASSCVAQLSQRALDRGFEKCVLYTDLQNPISNSIYQKIGYRAICDSLMLKFE